MSTLHGHDYLTETRYVFLSCSGERLDWWVVQKCSLRSRSAALEALLQQIVIRASHFLETRCAGSTQQARIIHLFFCFAYRLDDNISSMNPRSQETSFEKHRLSLGLFKRIRECKRRTLSIDDTVFSLDSTKSLDVSHQKGNFDCPEPLLNHSKSVHSIKGPVDEDSTSKKKASCRNSAVSETNTNFTDHRVFCPSPTTMIDLKDENEDPVYQDIKLRSRLEALRAQQTLFGEGHPDVLFSLQGLCSVHYRRGEYQHAQRVFDEACRRSSRFPDEGPPKEISIHAPFSEQSLSLWIFHILLPRSSSSILAFAFFIPRSCSSFFHPQINHQLGKDGSNSVVSSTISIFGHIVRWQCLHTPIFILWPRAEIYVTSYSLADYVFLMLFRNSLFDLLLARNKSTSYYALINLTNNSIHDAMSSYIDTTSSCVSNKHHKLGCTLYHKKSF